MKLQVLYPKDLIKIVQSLGFEEARQKGSHKTFVHADDRVLTIAFHSNKSSQSGFSTKS